MKSKLYRPATRSIAICMTLASLESSPISAAEPFWQEVAVDTDLVAEVDAANIRVREGVLTAWVRQTASRAAVFKDKNFRSVIALTLFDCEAEKSGVSTTTAFSGPRGDGRTVEIQKGLSVSSVSLDYQRPGTSGYQVLKFVCEFYEQLESGGTNAAMKRLEAAQAAAKAQRDAAEAKGPDTSAPARITRPANPDDYYPPGSVRREEQGSPVVEACVGPTGKLVREPRVIDRSGFPDLDAAAIKVAKATRFEAGKESGVATAESCLTFKINFSLHLP